MSGIGQRFLDAGYREPKPLIEVDGQPMIAHVVNLFPGETRFTFICQEEHLRETRLPAVLKRIAPSGEIVSIPPHKKGPVYAVAQAFDRLDDAEEVVVNYCDFGTYWDYHDFLAHTRLRKAAGAIPAYRGFHPHMLGPTNYAFIRDDSQWLLEIREKQPFTANRLQEYASNGTYYFQKGADVKKYFTLLMARDINTAGEYYVSMVYNLMVANHLKVSVYEIQHMLQWGTPRDLAEYQKWSDCFRRLIEAPPVIKPQPNSINLIPLAGRGDRFQQAGYQLPKPLLPVSGKPMVVQAAAALPPAEHLIFVCLGEHLDSSPLASDLGTANPKAIIVRLDQVTEGQAVTCRHGLDGQDPEAPLLIAACDNGILYDPENYNKLLNDDDIDAIIWTFSRHPSSAGNPHMYGWVQVDEANKAGRVSVKIPISDDPYHDQAVMGAFFFRKIKYFYEGYERLRAKNERVNNEFYLDSLMQELIELGYTVNVFEVDHYIGWGTPDDYRTFNYWQSFFHKCQWHPYRLTQDPTVDSRALENLTREFETFGQPHR
ncbi:MAG: NTP transferase domain-containing protein [Deltaproteobacteria bacterium]|nr:NTP transferase domain-containing protein [Deltaproteobacteria bacterium]